MQHRPPSQGAPTPGVVCTVYRRLQRKLFTRYTTAGVPQPYGVLGTSQSSVPQRSAVTRPQTGTDRCLAVPSSALAAPGTDR